MNYLTGIGLGGAAEARTQNRQLDIQQGGLDLRQAQQQQNQIDAHRKQIGSNIKQVIDMVNQAVADGDTRGIPRDQVLNSLKPIIGDMHDTISIGIHAGVLPSNTDQLFQGTIQNIYNSPTPGQVSSQKANEAGAIAGAKESAKQKAIGDTVTLNPEQTSQIGFPEGVIAQKSPNGEVKVLYQPTNDGTIRDHRVNSLVQRFVSDGMNEGNARKRAEDIVDGNVNIVISQDGRYARLVDEVNNTVTEVPIATEEPPRVEVKGPKLYDLTDLATGVVSSAKELYGGTVGQLPGLGETVPKDTIQARQQLRTSVNEMIRALSVNPRFPVGEINRIKDEIKLEPSVFDSSESLRAKMRSINDSLQLRADQANRDASDSSLPQEVRTEQAANASAIRNFLDILGVPDKEVPEGFTQEEWNVLTPEERARARELK